MDGVNVRWHHGRRFVGANTAGQGVVMDADVEHGGENGGVRPVELVLYALGGCTAIDVIAILEKKRQHVTDFEVRLTGTQRDEAPRIYTEISVEYVVTGHDVAANAVERAIELSEDKYCSVRGMLCPQVSVVSSYRILEAERT